MKSDLYELIHSLNKSEKRYFKIEAAKYTSDKNIYLVVYELLEKQRTYNPQALKRALEKTHPKAVKRLTTTKNYLYTLILKTLNAYYEDKSSVFEFNKRIQQVEILFFKGLYKQAEKILKQAKKIAVKMGLYPQQLLVLKWYIGNKTTFTFTSFTTHVDTPNDMSRNILFFEIISQHLLRQMLACLRVQ